MSEPAVSESDLSLAQTWRGLRPGMLYAEVVALLATAGLVDFEDAEEPEWMILENWEMELHFSKDGEMPLRQITWSDTRLHWGGNRVLEKPLREVLELLGTEAELAGWRPEDATLHALEDLEPPVDRPYTEEELLDGGTLWLPRKRWGLVMEQRLVVEIAWRAPADVPIHIVAPVTDEQLAASTLREPLATRIHGTGRKPFSYAQIWLTGVLFLALVGIIVYSMQEHRAWAAAPVVQAHIMELREERESPYRRFYTVGFTDENGVHHTGQLTSADFYISPREVGQVVEIRYLLMSPVRVHGPRSDKDFVFFRVVPRVGLAVAVYAVLLFLTWLPRRLRATNSEAAV